MVDAVEVAERKKYETMWGRDSYRERSPGMRHLDDAMARLCPRPGSTIADFGCGTGRVSAALNKLGLVVTAIDIAVNSCAEFSGEFVAACLWDLPESLGQFDYGFCADVMEHIPTAKVPMVLDSIANHSQRVYFQIANFVCHEGDAIGEHLHLTVKPFPWWQEMLGHYFVVEQGSINPKHHVFVCKSRAF